MRPLPLSLVAALCVLALAAPAALARPLSQPHVVVAVIDSGVTPSKQLAKRLVPGWDFVDNDATPTDGFGHGTELAGIVAAQCPKCLIMPVRVLGNGGLGQVPAVVKGIQYAVAHGAQVVNLSMTTPYDSPDLSAAIEWAVGQGVSVTVAAGNAGASTAFPGVETPHAIVVGSVDAAGKLFSWSNYGPWVDVFAPGTLQARSLEGKVVTATGTSASAAYVAGRAGDLLACNASLTPASVSQQLRVSLTPPSC